MSAELIRAMEAFGIIVDREPRLDGTPTRYRMAGKKSRSAFVIAKELDGKVYATYGTWMDRTQDQKWTNNGAGTEYCSAQWQALALNAEREREKVHAEAAKKAAELWAMLSRVNTHTSKRKAYRGTAAAYCGTCYWCPFMHRTEP